MNSVRPLLNQGEVDVDDGLGVYAYSSGCIMGIYCMLRAPLIVGMWAVLGLREYTILMHIFSVGFMHAKL